MQKNIGRSSKFLFMVAVIVSTLFPATWAWAPPAYDELNDTVLIDADVTDGVFSADITAESGNNISITGQLPLGDGDRGPGVAQVNLQLKNDVSEGQIKISPVPAPESAPPGAIAFFQIELTGFSDKDIKSAEITFWVGNEFVEVRLSRLHNGTWTLLKTSRAETGAKQSKYVAISPGFSTFAIVAQKGAVNTEAGGTTGSLPFTSGRLLYLMAALGLIFLVAGATIRIRTTK